MLVHITKRKCSGNTSDDWICWTVLRSGWRHILDFILLKITWFLVYDVVRSYEWLILSEITFPSAQKYVDELALQKYNDCLGLLCGLYNTFASSKGKGLILLTAVSVCLNHFLASLFSSVLVTYSIKINIYNSTFRSCLFHLIASISLILVTNSSVANSTHDRLLPVDIYGVCK